MTGQMVFEHEALAQRVLFGARRAGQFLAEELARLGAHQVMVIATERELARATPVLADVSPALVWDEVAQHVPLQAAERARAAAAEHGIDLLVCLGGGSSTGLAKAVALTTGIPIVAVPTTYAGSEATNVWGLTEHGTKRTGTDNRVLPVSVIYDAELTLSLPVGLSVASGLNALAHCVDSLWAPQADPINAALATEGVRALAVGLPAITADPEGAPGREQALYGAYLAAVAFASAGSGMHHKICHVLGGRFDLPHAPLHAVVLPHVLAFNAGSAGQATDRIAQALGAGDAVTGMRQLYERLQAPTALRELGLAEADLDEATELVLPYIPASNPRPVSAEDLNELLHAAWAGDTPGR
jgi:maleylacetate reductase